jgi:hypothetical protein
MSFLKNFLRNPLSQKKITKNRLRIYGQSVIEIITGKNGSGQYDMLISRLTNSYIKFFGKISGELTDLAIQKAKTTIVNNIILQFEQKVHKDYFLIGSKYEEGSPEFIEFFPNGKSEYDGISKTMFESIIIRFIAALTTYQGGVITPALLAEYEAIQDNYVAAHAIQSQKKSDVSTNREEGKVARTTFENDLFFAILNITAEFVETRNVIKEYFKVNLLFSPAHQPDDDTEDEEFSVILATLETKDSGLTNIAGKKARFINVSEAKVLIYTVANLENLDPSPTAITLDPDAEIEILLSELGAPDYPYLILRNLSDELEAEVVIEWVE